MGLQYLQGCDGYICRKYAEHDTLLRVKSISFVVVFAVLLFFFWGGGGLVVVVVFFGWFHFLQFGNEKTPFDIKIERISVKTRWAEITELYDTRSNEKGELDRIHQVLRN